MYLMYYSRLQEIVAEKKPRQRHGREDEKPHTAYLRVLEH